MSDDIPLFPLSTVLFPGGPLALRIFEPRYLDMLGRCLQQGRGFCVVAIETGSEVGAAETFAVGTLVEIVDWYQEPDGLLGISVVGRDRIRVRSKTRREDGLYVGQIEVLAHEPRVPLPAEHSGMADLLHKVLAPLGSRYHSVTPAYDDASWVGYRLAEVLPLPVEFKQTLLEVEDALYRLEELRRKLKATGADA
jgi:hypothetical protein